MKKFQKSIRQALMHFETEVGVRSITPDYCCQLTDNMPCRLKEVIKNKGSHTKYQLQKYFFKSV